MDERRKLPRKYLVIYSRVFDRHSGRVIGYLSDLNAEGMMIIGETRLTENEKVDVYIDLPDDPQFARRKMTLRVRIAYCKPDVDPTFVNTGMEFESLSPEDMDTIEKMIEAYEFHRNVPLYPTSPSSLDL